MEILKEDEQITIIYDSRHFLKTTLKLCLLLVFFFGSILLIFSIKLNVFIILIIIVVFANGYSKTKHDKFIIEKMILLNDRIILQHIVDKDVLFFKEIEYSQIKLIYFEDNSGLTAFSREWNRKKGAEKRRGLKISTFNSEIYSFGFLLKKEEFNKIIELLEIYFDKEDIFLR